MNVYIKSVYMCVRLYTDKLYPSKKYVCAYPYRYTALLLFVYIPLYIPIICMAVYKEVQVYTEAYVCLDS